MGMNETAPKRRARWARELAVALLLSGLALAIPGLFSQSLALRGVFSFFCLVVMVSSLQGGATAGLLSTLVGALGGAYLYLEPKFSLTVTRKEDRFALLLFIAVGASISAINGVLRRVVRKNREVTARLQEQKEALRFLWKSSEPFVQPLDRASLLGEVGRLATPRLGDACTIDLVDSNGQLNRSAATHVNPIKEAALRDIARRYPMIENPDHPVTRVVRTGQPLHFSSIDDALLRSMSRDEAHLALLRSLHPVSAIIVPLTVRGRILGALSFWVTESDRRYDEHDLALTVELAQRTALAIDNLRLFERLRVADERKNEFLALLAHELRNPLAAIRTAAALLETGKAEPATARHAHRVLVRQASHMAALLDDLLDVARITHGKIALKTERVALVGLIESAVQTMCASAAARRQVLAVSIPAEPLWVEADPVRIEQVLTNLIGNAVKYTDAGGSIIVSAAREGDEATLRVRDDGIGIAEAAMARLFEPFAQVSGSLARSQGGLGLGLALVRRLVELHDGSVTVYSEGPGRGAEFVVRLPLAAAPVAASASAPPAPVESKSIEPRRVLIVDDNADSADVLADLLRLWGHEVYVAHDGRSGIDRGCALAPDVALLDIGLPDLDGFEVARRLRSELGDRILLVAVTGYGGTEFCDRARQQGFDEQLTKPVDPATLERLFQSRPRGRPRLHAVPSSRRS